MSGIIIIAIIILSGYISRSWVKAECLSHATIQYAVILMGITIGLQFPVSFYSGGLMGLQRQVLLNVINIFMATLRGIGSILVLWVVSPTIMAFFCWQIFTSGIQATWLLVSLWRSMPASNEKADFKMSILFRIWRFAAGMFGISTLATLLTQTDKIILSRMLPLEMFGYYSLSGMVAMSLYRLIGPIFTGVYPRMTQLVTLKDTIALKDLYHSSCQVMSVMILPAAMVLIFFSKEILLLWTQNPTTANQTHLLVSLLVTGTALNGLMNLPYALQLAHGWTNLAFYINLISVIVLVPLILLMTKYYGAVGAASVWVILNSGYVLIGIQLMHRRLLKHEKWRWYRNDVGIPMLCAFLIAGVGRILMEQSISKPAMLIYITIISTLTLCTTAWITPTTKNWLIRIFSKKINYKV